MCGRYTLTQHERRLQERYGIIDREAELFLPRFNIAPTQQAPVLLWDDKPRLKLLRWGLIPFWAKDEKIGGQLINARSETVADKPAFRGAFKKRRCLVLSDGFYEWMKTPTGKVPVWITRKDQQPFCFAGLWENWRNAEGEDVLSFTILTTSANELLSQVHNRMPVILDEQAFDGWLDPARSDKGSLAGLLRPYPSDALQFYPVSTLVNSPRNDNPKCIERLSAGDSV